jgi:hypothetical protein
MRARPCAAQANAKTALQTRNLKLETRNSKLDARNSQSAGIESNPFNPPDNADDTPKPPAPKRRWSPPTG